MKKRWRVILISAGVFLFVPHIQAAPVVVNSTPMSLGTVNGEVVHDALSIERTLSNPLLMSVTQDELNSKLSKLLISDAKLIKNQKGEVTVMLTSLVKEGTLEAVLSFEVWLDGKKANVQGEVQGHNVEIYIETSFRLLEVRVTKPLQIKLPKNYRGPFNLVFDIEAKA